MDLGASTVWMFFIRKDGRINWLRSVGAVLFCAALAQCGLALAMSSRLEHDLEKAEAQWKRLDAISESKAPPTDSSPVVVEYVYRPEQLRREYEREIDYRFLWAGLTGLLGAAVFATGYFLDGIFNAP